MRFLIDANLPRSIIELIVRLGHEAEFARDIGLGAAPDRAIAAHAQATQAALLTRDLDFADVRNYPPEQYSGDRCVPLPGRCRCEGDRAACRDISSRTEARRATVWAPRRGRTRPSAVSACPVVSD
jgi:hypothetical protein